jgi:hypothetical protein
MQVKYFILTNMFSSECLASQQFRKTGINKFLSGDDSNCNKSTKQQFNKIRGLTLYIYIAIIYSDLKVILYTNPGYGYCSTYRFNVGVNGGREGNIKMDLMLVVPYILVVKVIIVPN